MGMGNRTFFLKHLCYHLVIYVGKYVTGYVVNYVVFLKATVGF